jgi:ring-1,2-phenylacetyl-CoA epoxidase subunit PaaD
MIRMEPGTRTNYSDEIQAVWDLLDEVKDPEIPVVSIVELGIIREVNFSNGSLEVTMTPTFSGCPALYAIQAEITKSLLSAGYKDARIHITYDPPWTTDWITAGAREKLKNFGLAPPPIHNGSFAILLLDPVQCPYCGAEDTEIKNSFGSTLCRAIFYCRACQQPFEQFKPL